jgi:uncharacterized lipoprotein YmbA
MSRRRISALPPVLSRAVSAGCLVLAACGSSPPMRYYTLEAVALPVGSAMTAPSDAAPANQVAVRVEPIVLPPELDRLELVSRSGPYRVRVADSFRWAAPLDDQIRRVLSDDLAARLPAGLVAEPSEPATNEPRRLLSVAIVEFYADEDCGATLRADWTLRGPKDERLHGSEQFKSQAAPACAAAVPAAVPAAMSAALGTLSERLAAAILAQPAAVIGPSAAP